MTPMTDSLSLHVRILQSSGWHDGGCYLQPILSTKTADDEAQYGSEIKYVC